MSLIDHFYCCDQLSLHYEILLDSQMSERHFIQLNRPILKTMSILRLSSPLWHKTFLFDCIMMVGFCFFYNLFVTQCLY